MVMLPKSGEKDASIIRGSITPMIESETTRNSEPYCVEIAYRLASLPVMVAENVYSPAPHPLIEEIIGVQDERSMNLGEI